MQIKFQREEIVHLLKSIRFSSGTGCLASVGCVADELATGDIGADGDLLGGVTPELALAEEDFCCFCTLAAGATEGGGAFLMSMFQENVM